EEGAWLAGHGIDGEHGHVGLVARPQLPVVLLLVRGEGGAGGETGERALSVEALLGEPAAGRIARGILARARGVEAAQGVRALDRKIAAAGERRVRPGQAPP